MNRTIKILMPGMLATLIFAGCAEQPIGYVYKPSDGQIVDLARLTAETVGVLYDQLDEAVYFLDAASLTSDYQAILPEGWYPSRDTTGHTFYVHNYLDQKFNLMAFDREPIPGAVRSPSNIYYDYLQFGSFLSLISGGNFYGDITEERRLSVHYANNGQDPLFVDGWYSVSRSTPFEYQIEYSTQAGNQTLTQTYYEFITWYVEIKEFSIDPNGQQGHFVIDGTFPQRDETGITESPHTSADIAIDRQGHGTGTVKLYGEDVATIHFKGRRGTGFDYDFTLIGR